jgi:hypothetical protein
MSHEPDLLHQHEQTLLRAALVVQIVVDVARHERQRVEEGWRAGGGGGGEAAMGAGGGEAAAEQEATPDGTLACLAAGQHCLCAGSLEPQDDFFGGVSYPAAKGFKVLVGHLLFVAQFLTEVIEASGWEGLSQGAGAAADAEFGRVRQIGGGAGAAPDATRAAVRR